MNSEKFAEGIAQVATGAVSFGGGFYGLRWFVTWLTARLDLRQASIDAQDQRLDREWQKIRENVTARLEKVETQNEALRFAFHHVAGALIRVDPQNPALIQAEKLLAQAFPIDLEMLADRAAAALDLDDERRRAGKD